jgi:hypothetical protein
MPNDKASELSELEKKRKNALAKYDARAYASLCDELGNSPEDEELYEQGMKEIIEEKKGGIELLEKYSNLLKDSCNIDLAAHEENTETKKTLLRRYFKEFMPGGINDLDRMSSEDIGDRFKTMVLKAAKSKKETQRQKA